MKKFLLLSILFIYTLGYSQVKTKNYFSGVSGVLNQIPISDDNGKIIWGNPIFTFSNLTQVGFDSSGVFSSSTLKANGEQFYTPSGENVYGKSNSVIESQSGGTGVDFTPSSTFTAIKYTTSPTASFVQGIVLKIKKNGALSQTSSLKVAFYSDNAGVPGTQTGSSGTVFGGQTSTGYQDFNITFQNISTPLTPNAVYWVVLTRIESGGNFVINSKVGTGTTFQGSTATTATTETNIQISNIIYARNYYGAHFVGGHSHGVWGTSNTGVGVRGDSENHYGGYFQSASGDGVKGNSTYGNGLVGNSINQVGVYAITNSSIGYPALRADNTNGSSFLALDIHGTTVSNSTITAISFKKSGGTASQFLKADGSVDSNTYLTTTTDSRPYKVYTGTITQTATAAPIATLSENNTGITISWARNSAGSYAGTISSGTFPVGKTVCFISGGAQVGIVSAYNVNTTTINIMSANNVGTFADGILSTSSLEIRIYN